MATEQPFSPDDLYCVYCHAPAAGPCATCGALCCGACVELVMGLTTQRAVCRSCIQEGRPAVGIWSSRLVKWLIAAFLAGLAIILYVAASK